MDIKYYLSKINVFVKQENSRFINIKCPICNEGKSTFKARGYILLGREQPVYNCHNECGSMSFYNFLSQVDSKVAEEYKQELRKEKLQNFKDTKSYANEIKDVFKEDKLFEVKPFTNAIYTFNEKDYVYPLIDLTEEALIYLLNRGFTKEEIKDIKFCKETNDVVIPFWYQKELNEVYGMQMRNIYEKRFHIQIFGNPKVWNIPYILSLPKGTRVYIFEAIFDAKSSGMNNVISILGRTISEEVLKMLKDYDLVFVLDADKQGDESIYRYATEGFKCVVHEKDMYNFKDFNKLRELGVSTKDIQNYIERRTFSPLKSQMLVKLNKV